MKKENSKNNTSIDFIDALIAIGKEFNNQLKEYTNNGLFGELFPDMKTDFENFDNAVKELDKSIKNMKKDSNDISELNHAHIEETETEKSYEYQYDDDGMTDHDEIIEFLKKKLNDFTFAACTNNERTYKLTFNFGKIFYAFLWDKNVMHFLGDTNDPDFVFVNEDFYFDEVKNDFFICEFDKKEYPKEILVEKCCNEGCPSEELEDIEDIDEDETRCCDVIREDEDLLTEDQCCNKVPEESRFTADTLFSKINKEVAEAIEDELLPNIKTGVDRVFDYQMYSIDRTGNIQGFDIIVFTLENVQLNCEKPIRKFWEIIPYERLVRFFIETYGFTKVYILDKNETGEIVHEVRCHLK